MKHTTLTLPLFPSEMLPTKPDARERHRFDVMIETMFACFNNPIVVCERPCSAIPAPVEWLRRQRAQIELERAACLFKLIHREPPASLDDIRACATTLTNPEKAGVLAVISGEMPLPTEHFHEYARAFAHCIEFETFVKIFCDGHSEPIHLSAVEQFYYRYGGRGGWGWLDDAEREWIRQFNAKYRACHEKQT